MDINFKETCHRVYNSVYPILNYIWFSSYLNNIHNTNYKLKQNNIMKKLKGRRHVNVFLLFVKK